MLTLLMSALVANASPDYDSYEPTAAVAKATVVFVHGGAWIGGDKSEDRALAPTFTSRGYRFLAINYRLAPAHPHPAPVDDLERILSSLKDPSVYLIGHSAGAHMIAFWNSAHTNAHVKGFIGLEGIYDLPALVKTWPTYKDWFVSKEFGGATNWPAASPTQLKMKSSAPWLVIHSEKDELVDLAQSKAFTKHFSSAKIPAEFVRLKTDSHFGVVQSLANPESETSKAVLKFLAR